MIAKPACLSRFPFYGLHTIAEHCVPGDVEVMYRLHTPGAFVRPSRSNLRLMDGSEALSLVSYERLRGLFSKRVALRCIITPSDRQTRAYPIRPDSVTAIARVTRIDTPNLPSPARERWITRLVRGGEK